jgi:hypothetical protein
MMRRNRKVIVNPFSVIVNPTALNLSTKDRRVPQPICRQFADGFSEFADSVDFGFRESFANRPIIDRRNHQIDRSGRETSRANYCVVSMSE